jgi:MFS family permease
MSNYPKIEIGRRRSSATSSTSGNPIRRRSSAFAIQSSSAVQDAVGGGGIELPLRHTIRYEKIGSSDCSNVSAESNDDIAGSDERCTARDGLFRDGDHNTPSSQTADARWHSFSSDRPISIGDYCSVLYRYPMYRAYMLSHVCQNLGDWFVRIASILIVEELAASGATGKSLSHMALARLLPNAVFAQVGSILADRFDRRNLMICIDIVSGFIVLGFLVAIRYEDLPLFFVITSLRSALGAIYFPATTGIVPLLVPEPGDMQLAVTMNSWAWGMTSIVGGLMAGTLTAAIGLKACYIIDCATFLLSSVIIAVGVKGDFRVGTVTGIALDEPTPGAAIADRKVGATAFLVIRDLVTYLWTCGFGMMVYLKSSASFVWGIEDIVGAEFCTVFRDDGTEDEKASSMHMGMLFSVIGAGCMTGPALTNLISDAHRPYTLQRSCLVGLLFLTGGWLLISMATSYPKFLAASFIRTMGSGIVWVNSTLILQTMSEKEILGRVLAVEYTLFTLFEAASSTVTGSLDEAGLNKNELALFGFSLGVLMVTVWGTYYSFSLGAAQPIFNNNYQFDTSMAEEADQHEFGERPPTELPGSSKEKLVVV